jgi:hypothetical protein
MLSKGSASKPPTVNPNPQPWRWSHPRVLVEHPDEEAGMAIASGLRFAGYAVAICPGPRGHGKCPLTGPAGCAPAHEADLVVCSLGYESEQAQEILRELRMRYPDTPLLVEPPVARDESLNELLEGCHLLPVPATPGQIVSAVQSIVGEPVEASAAGA